LTFQGLLNQIRNISFRGDISLLAWAITTRDLIKSMKQKLVKSVFEGDIFYWWEDSYKELSAGDSFLYSPYHRYEKQKAYFSEALADIILTLYKFDFSEIVGDPLGTLYQRYFDKETRKALGEFYTPIEVVKYILDAVGYEGQGIIHKRLLDPACGSGTFLVEALRRYLKASERIADEEGWSSILKRLCNEYCIAGFDIHPFATFMAQMQFMLVLIPAYKKAMEKDPHFVLNRLPIFRTDSLIDETKGESRKVTIEESVRGIRHILIDTSLPVDGGNLKIKMPYDKDVFERAGLLNAQEYFAALQAVFDTVKESARDEKYAVDKEELERNFKRYLEDKGWNRLVSFFTPYAEHFLQKFKELKATFGDGKLIKSVEDIMLAAILKNYVKYNFVVGNPPYVRQEKIKEEKEIYKALYSEVYEGRADIYVYFIKRGADWLQHNGKFGYIVSGKFMKAHCGNYIRAYIPEKCLIEEIIDLRGAKVFKEATNDPIILILRRNGKIRNHQINIVIVKKKVPSDEDELILKNTLESISKNIGKFYQDEYLISYAIAQKRLNSEIRTEKDTGRKYLSDWDLTPASIAEVRRKIISASKGLTLKDVCDVYRGIRTGANEIFTIDKEKEIQYPFEKEVSKKLIEGKDVRKYLINYRNLKLLYLTHETDIEKYPTVKKYLLKFKDTLEQRAQYRQRKERGEDIEWFEIEQPLSPSIFEVPKIVTQRVSNDYGFAFDDGEFYTLETCSTIVPKPQYRRKVIFLLGLLNSKPMEFFAKTDGKALGKRATNLRNNF